MATAIHHAVSDDNVTATLCGKRVEDLQDPDSWHFMSEINFVGSDIHFNCVDCHKVLTEGQKHSRPDDEDYEKPDD